MARRARPADRHEAGLSHVFSHRFRHTFAHLWLADGRNEGDHMRHAQLQSPPRWRDSGSTVIDDMIASNSAKSTGAAVRL